MKRISNFYATGTLSAIFILSGLSQPAAAQCPSTWDASNYEIASQDWSGQNSVPLNFTSLYYTPTGAKIALGNGSEFASSGDTNYLLNAADHYVYKVTEGMLPGTQTPGILASAVTPWAGYTQIQVLNGQLYAWVNTRLGAPFANGLTFDAGSSILGVTFDGQYLWVASSGYLWRLNPATATTAPSLAGKYSLASAAGPLTYDGRYIWMLSTNSSGNSLVKIDPSIGQQIASVAAAASGSPVFDGVYFWFAAGSNGLAKMDPVSTNITQIPASAALSSSLGFDGVAVWAGNGSGAVQVRTCDGRSLAAISLAGVPAQVVYNGKHYWATYQNSNMVTFF
jgi:hypothetical protein